MSPDDLVHLHRPVTPGDPTPQPPGETPPAQPEPLTPPPGPPPVRATSRPASDRADVKLHSTAAD